MDVWLMCYCDVEDTNQKDVVQGGCQLYKGRDRVYMDQLFYPKGSGELNQLTHSHVSQVPAEVGQKGVKLPLYYPFLASLVQSSNVTKKEKSIARWHDKL